jgi:hypothetical protein
MTLKLTPPAALALTLAATSVAMSSPAVAATSADPGGECCGDLETRVAELEATTSRKGNRAVSLQISGEVNRAMLIWDDGKESDAYIVDNAAPSEGSRLRFSGEGTLKPGWKSGFIIEMGFTDSSSMFVNQADDEGGDTSFETRLANWYIEGERLGRLTLGQQSSATDGITTIDLSRAHTDPVTWHNASFGIRDGDGDYTGLTWGNVAWGLEGYKGDFIRYDTPAFYGFVASASWGENDSWDMALRFQKDLGTVRVAAGAGYLWVGDESTVSLYPNDTVVASGSISVMHVPTGLFGNFAGGRVDLSRDALASDDNPDEGGMWMAQAGWERRITPYGATTLYGEYGQYRDILLGYSNFDGNNTPALTGGSVAPGSITGTEVQRWGVGAAQQFDSAALEMYAVFNHFEAEVQTTAGDGGALPWYGVVVGSRMKF